MVQVDLYIKCPSSQSMRITTYHSYKVQFNMLQQTLLLKQSTSYIQSSQDNHKFRKPLSLSPSSSQHITSNYIGFIEYKFISYIGEHLTPQQLEQQHKKRNQLIMRQLHQLQNNQSQCQCQLQEINESKLTEMIRKKDEIIVQKDKIIQCLQKKIYQLIKQTKRLKQQHQKLKQKYQLTVMQKNQPIQQSQNRNSLKSITQLQLAHGTSLNYQILHHTISQQQQLQLSSFINNTQRDVGISLSQPLPQSQSNKSKLLNTNINVRKQKQRQKKLQIRDENAMLREQNQQLKEDIAIIEVENQLLREQLQQLNNKYERVQQVVESSNNKHNDYSMKQSLLKSRNSQLLLSTPHYRSIISTSQHHPPLSTSHDHLYHLYYTSRRQHTIKQSPQNLLLSSYNYKKNINQSKSLSNNKKQKNQKRSLDNYYQVQKQKKKDLQKQQKNQNGVEKGGVKSRFFSIAQNRNNNNTQIHQNTHIDPQHAQNTIQKLSQQNSILQQRLHKTQQQYQNLLNQLSHYRTAHQQTTTKPSNQFKQQQKIQLIKVKRQLQIQLQNYKVRQDKMMEKNQEREKKLEKMWREAVEEERKSKEEIQVMMEKLGRIESRNVEIAKQNAQLQLNIQHLITQLRNLSQTLQSKTHQSHILQNQLTQLTSRLHSSQYAQTQLLQQLQQLKLSAEKNQSSFQQLFNQRNQCFLRIQSSKNSQIDKLKSVISGLEERLEWEVGEGLVVKNEMEKSEKQVERIQREKYQLQEQLKVVQQQLRTVRTQHTQQRQSLQQQCQSLRSQLLHLCQQLTSNQQQLQTHLLTITSLQSQLSLLTPVHDHLLQLQHKHNTQQQSLHSVITQQNIKFLQLQQRYSNLTQQIEIIRKHNMLLQAKQQVYERMKLELHQKIFEKERLCLAIEQQRNIVEIQIKKLAQQLNDTKQKYQDSQDRNRQLQKKLQQKSITIKQLNDKLTKNQQQLQQVNNRYQQQLLLKQQQQSYPQQPFTRSMQRYRSRAFTNVYMRDNMGKNKTIVPSNININPQYLTVDNLHIMNQQQLPQSQSHAQQQFLNLRSSRKYTYSVNPFDNPIMIDPAAQRLQLSRRKSRVLTRFKFNMNNDDEQRGVNNPRESSQIQQQQQINKQSQKIELDNNNDRLSHNRAMTLRVDDLGMKRKDSMTILSPLRASNMQHKSYFEDQLPSPASAFSKVLQEQLREIEENNQQQKRSFPTSKKVQFSNNIQFDDSNISNNNQSNHDGLRNINRRKTIVKYDPVQINQTHQTKIAEQEQKYQSIVVRQQQNEDKQEYKFGDQIKIQIKSEKENPKKNSDNEEKDEIIEEGKDEVKVNQKDENVQKNQDKTGKNSQKQLSSPLMFHLDSNQHQHQPQFNTNQQQHQQQHSDSGNQPQININQVLNQNSVQNSNINNSNFSPSEESQYQQLVTLSKKDIIQRVHELKIQIVGMVDQIEGLKLQVIQYQRELGINQPQEQGQELVEEKSQQYAQSDENNTDSAHPKIAIHGISSTHKKISTNLLPFQSHHSITQQQLTAQINKLSENIAQKQLTIQQQKQQLTALNQQLQEEKIAANKLYEEVEALFIDTNKIEETLKQRNNLIQQLNQRIIDQKALYDQKLQILLAESLQKDSLLQQTIVINNNLQQTLQKSLQQRMELQQQLQISSKQHIIMKSRLKQSELSYKQYEEQSQLEILSLKQQIDKLVKDGLEKDEQLHVMAEKYLNLQVKNSQFERVIISKTSQNSIEKQKIIKLVQKYQELAHNYDLSEKNRHKLHQQLQSLRNEIHHNQSIIQQLQNTFLITQKKHQIQLSTQRQSLKQMRQKNQQLKQHIVKLKYEIGILSEELVKQKEENKELVRDYKKIEEQVKEIVRGYGEEVKQWENKVEILKTDIVKNTEMMNQKQALLQLKIKQNHSLHIQHTNLLDSIHQLTNQYQSFKRKHHNKLQQANQKYEMKNHQLQLMKIMKFQKQTETTVSNMMDKHNEKEKQLEQLLLVMKSQVKKNQKQIEEKKREMRKKDKEIQQLKDVNKRIKAKLDDVGIEGKRQQYSPRNVQLNTQIKLTNNNRNNLPPQHPQSPRSQSTILTLQTTISSLQQQITHYSTRLSQLQQQNHQLSTINALYQQNILKLTKVKEKKELQMKKTIESLDQELMSYKKRFLGN